MKRIKKFLNGLFISKIKIDMKIYELFRHREIIVKFKDNSLDELVIINNIYYLNDEWIINYTSGYTTKTKSLNEIESLKWN
jgi:hypothetical protein